jgi:ADP-ribosylglycohydrolase
MAECVRRALEADRAIDRLFWFSSLVERLASRPTHERQAAFAAAARLIYATFRVSPAERQEAVRFLADRLIPLD